MGAYSSLNKAIAQMGGKIQSTMKSQNAIKNQFTVTPESANNYALILADYLTANPNATMENSALLRSGSNIMRNVKNLPIAMQIDRLRNVESVVSEIYLVAGLDKKKSSKIPAIAELIRAEYIESSEIPAWVTLVLAGDFDNYLSGNKVSKTDSTKKSNLPESVAPIGNHITGNKDTVVTLPDSANPIVPKQVYHVGKIALTGGKESLVAPNTVIFTVRIQGDVSLFTKGSTFDLNNMSGYLWTVIKVNADAGKVYAQYTIKSQQATTLSENKPAPYSKPSTSTAQATAQANSKPSAKVLSAEERIDALEAMLTRIAGKLGA